MSDAAVILAAGAGTRFRSGGDEAARDAKLLAPLAGRPLITWALAPALDAGFDEVVVVTGAVDLRTVLPDAVTVLENPQWSRGQAHSLHLALEHCAAAGHDRVLVGLGDEPGLTAAAWRAVRGAPGGPLVFATYQGRRGHPVRLGADVWSLLPVDGEEGARAVAREHPDLVTECTCEGEPDDVDTTADLQRWETSWS